MFWSSLEKWVVKDVGLSDNGAMEAIEEKANGWSMLFFKLKRGKESKMNMCGEY